MKIKFYPGDICTLTYDREGFYGEPVTIVEPDKERYSNYFIKLNNGRTWKGITNNEISVHFRDNYLEVSCNSRFLLLIKRGNYKKEIVQYGIVKFLSSLAK